MFQSPLLTGAAANAASSSPLLLQQLPYTSRSFNLTNTNSTAYPYPSAHGNSTFAPPAPGAVDAGQTPLAWFLVSVIGADLSGDDGDEELKRWSSFIGICIAVIGNVFISLALNIQKFAHMRLARKRVLLERAPATAVEVLDPEDGSNTTMGVGATTTPAGAAVAAASLPDEVDAAGSEDETTTLLGDAKKNKKKKIKPRLGSSGRKKKAAAAAGEDDTDTSYITSPLWWLGLTLMFFGECGNFLAYGFAPASIVSPLGVVALVTNCVIAPLMLKEPFRARDVLGVLVSIAGAVTVVWSAEKEEVKLGPDEILSAISEPAFLIYLLITLALISALLFLSRHHGHRTILIDLGLVALFGGYTVLSTKGISSLISSSFYHIFQYPIAYLFTFILAVTAILQVKYLNRALQRFDSTQVIPTQFVLFTLSVIIGSAVLYRDFEGVTKQRVVKFGIGCSLTFVGVYLISSMRERRKSGRKQQQYDTESLLSVQSNINNINHTNNPLSPSVTAITTSPSRTQSISSNFALASPVSSSVPGRHQQHHQRPSLSRAISSAAVSDTVGPPLHLSASPPRHSTSSSSSSTSSSPDRRQSETEHAMIPGVMTGFQIGEVMRASGSLRRVVAAGDAGFAAAAAAATGQRGRKGSLSEVVLGLVRGKSVTGRPSQSRGSTSGRGVPTGRGEMEEEQHLMERDEDAADREEAVVLEEEEEEGRGNEGNTATGVSVLLPALATDQDLESEWARREDEATRMNDRDRER